MTGVVIAMTVVASCATATDAEPPENKSKYTPAPAVSEVTTTTIAEIPSARLYKLSRSASGLPTRFDGCSGPIKILLNPGDLAPLFAPFTNANIVGQLGGYLQQYAEELADLTGLDIIYGGTTDQELDPALAARQAILLKFGPSGFPGGSAADSDHLTLYGEESDGWQQIISFQQFENSAAFARRYESTTKTSGANLGLQLGAAGQRWLKSVLARALGLEPLTEDDMSFAGVAPENHGAQIMYRGPHQETDGRINLTWGEGDRAGLTEVGSSNSCF